jgi:hypothetical protein
VSLTDAENCPSSLIEIFDCNVTFQLEYISTIRWAFVCHPIVFPSMDRDSQHGRFSNFTSRIICQTEECRIFPSLKWDITSSQCIPIIQRSLFFLVVNSIILVLCLLNESMFWSVLHDHWRAAGITSFTSSNTTRYQLYRLNFVHLFPCMLFLLCY